MITSAATAGVHLHVEHAYVSDKCSLTMKIVDKIVIGINWANRSSTVDIRTPYAQSRGHYDGREKGMSSMNSVSKKDLYIEF